MSRLTRFAFLPALVLAVSWGQQAIAGPGRVFNEVGFPLDVRFIDQFGNVAHVVVPPRGNVGLPLTPGHQRLIVRAPGGNVLLDRSVAVPVESVLLVWVPSGRIDTAPFLAKTTARRRAWARSPILLGAVGTAVPTTYYRAAPRYVRAR